MKGSSKRTGLCRLAVEGEFNIYTAHESLETLSAQVDDYQQFELHLEMVEEVDSAAVQLLLAFSRHLTEQGKQLTLANMSEPVAELLQLYRLQDRFNSPEAT